MSDLTFKIESKAVLDLIKRVPRIINGFFNRSFGRSLARFSKEFTQARLRRGIFEVRRKFRLGRSAIPGIPAKMRRAGFVGRVKNKQKLAGKEYEIRTSNPLLKIRETGGVIRPRRGKFLFVRLRRVRGRRARNADPRGTIVAKLRFLEVKPVLRFEATFKGRRPKIIAEQKQGLDEQVRRLNRTGR